MPGWLNRLLGPKEGAAPAGDRLLDADREVQALRLELAEQDRALAGLKEELERRRAGESARVAEALAGRLEALAGNAAGPAVQIVTLAHLEEEGKPVAAKDALSLARRLVRALEDQGMALEGRIGEQVPFDPNRHEPLSAETALAPGAPAVIRVPGVSIQGKVVRKASVEG